MSVRIALVFIFLGLRVRSAQLLRMAIPPAARLLGGSWAGTSRVVNALINRVIRTVTILIALLRTTHEPPSISLSCKALFLSSGLCLIQVLNLS